MQAGITVTEYSPRKVKQSVTGNGNAGKEQVWKMLQQIMVIKQTALKYYDASDALAVAVCHHFQENALPISAPAKAKSWKQFIDLHPAKVKIK